MTGLSGVKNTGLVLIRWSLAIFVNGLLNMIDAIAVGQLIFPRTDSFFQQFSIDAICLYLVCTSAAQLIYPAVTSFNASLTAGMMAESLPFINSIALIIKRGYLLRHPNSNGSDDYDYMRLMPTLLISMSIHTLCISISFFLLAFFKLEWLVRKFPKYVLLGAMGGIGTFLLKTALQQSQWRLALSLSGMIPALSTVILRRRMTNPFLVPMVLLGLIFGFYFVTLGTGSTLAKLREDGWLVHSPSSRISPLRIYKHWDPSKVDWKLIGKVMPTILGSSIFAMLHLPINAPSFARSCHLSFKMSRELIANGLINFFTAFVGLLPSYFIYTASVLFQQAGADHKACSYVLGLVTGAAAWIAIPYIRFIPTPAVLFLIFYLGFELLGESLFDGFFVCSFAEFLTICLTIVTMLIVGFSQGLLSGLLLAGFMYWHARKACKNVNSIGLLGNDWRLTNSYSPGENSFLMEMSLEVLPVRIEGILTFVNADVAYDFIMTEISHHRPRLLLLDLSLVDYADLNLIEAIQEVASSGAISNLFIITSCERIKMMCSMEKVFVASTMVDAVTQLDRYQLIDLSMDFIDFPEQSISSETASLISLENGESKSTARRKARIERARNAYIGTEEEESSILASIDTPMMLTIKEGEFLFKAHDSVETIYIVESGLLEEYEVGLLVSKRRFHQGSWIGLDGFTADSQPTRTNCVASRDSFLRCIPKQLLMQVPQSQLSSLKFYTNK